MKRNLSPINLLDELSQPGYADLMAEFVPVKYNKDTLLYAPGHDGDFVFIIRKGRARVYLAFEDKDFSLAFLTKGDIYATHTRAYVQTMEDSELLTMPTAKFHGCMIRYPVFSRTIMGVLGVLLTRTFSIIEGLVFKDVSQRIIDFILYESRHNGRTLRKGRTVKIDLTMEQLAAIVGASRQTVSTIVNQMQKAGVLEKNGKEYFISTPAILKEFPNC
jgi:CRP-like cAMP-binding protein